MISTQLVSLIHRMKHSPAHNYVIPGLTSWLIGTPHREHGCIRMFTMSRDHEEPIIPHSHRFDFRCLVLAGEVRNCIWTETSPEHGDLYELSDVTYEGTLGKHERTVVGRSFYRKDERLFVAGSEYGMAAEQFHSIFFSRGAEVLFFEGPNRLEKSQVLEPVVLEETIPLFRTEAWMFRREGRDA